MEKWRSLQALSLAEGGKALGPLWEETSARRPVGERAMPQMPFPSFHT